MNLIDLNLTPSLVYIAVGAIAVLFISLIVISERRNSKRRAAELREMHFNSAAVTNFLSARFKELDRKNNATLTIPDFESLIESGKLSGADLRLAYLLREHIHVAGSVLRRESVIVATPGCGMIVGPQCVEICIYGIKQTDIAAVPARIAAAVAN